MENLLPQDGEAFYYPEFFDPKKSDLYFQKLLNETPWKQEPIKIFGKVVMQPRLVAWYGSPDKSYSYSGITMKLHSWTPTLITIKKAIEQVAGVEFNGALLNLYRDEKDSMGLHRDNEKELGVNPVIGSVSLGATRKFTFRHYRERKLRVSLELQNGSFLLMKGETQHFWQHEVPKEKAPIGARINLTFRVIKK